IGSSVGRHPGGGLLYAIHPRPGPEFPSRGVARTLLRPPARRYHRGNHERTPEREGTMAEVERALEALLIEERRFAPPSEFRERANASDPGIYARAAADPEAFWAEWARELDWIEPWDRVLDWRPPHAQWFVGGELNAAYHCGDRHAGGARRAQADLYREVNKFANVLKRLGVRAGDRVAIYLPMIPEAVVAMLACARIGSPHSVVFGGFSSESLRDRINDAQAKVLITADGGYRRGR